MHDPKTTTRSFNLAHGALDDSNKNMLYYFEYRGEDHFSNVRHELCSVFAFEEDQYVRRTRLGSIFRLKLDQERDAEANHISLGMDVPMERCRTDHTLLQVQEGHL